jgi:threonine dehydratase
LAVKAAAPHCALVGVEVEASSPFTLSLEAGRITEITPRPSMADGLVGNLEPGTMTFPLVKQVVDYVVTISEEELARAMKGLASEEHLIVEAPRAAAQPMAGKASASGTTRGRAGHGRQCRHAEVASRCEHASERYQPLEPIVGCAARARDQETRKPC